MENKYYDVLDVDKNADRQQIKVAYRSKARQFHPDLNRDPGSAELFKIVQEAYEVLSDDDRRKEYDKELSQAQAARKPVNKSRPVNPSQPRRKAPSDEEIRLHEELHQEPETITVMRLSKRWLARRILMIIALIVIPAIIWISSRNIIAVILYYVVASMAFVYLYEIAVVSNIGLIIWLITSVVDRTYTHILLSILLLMLVNILTYIINPMRPY